MKKVLQPILHRDSYNEPIESELLGWLKEVLFDPLFDILRHAGLDVRANSGTVNALRAAIESGRVWYAQGAFTGQFNAAISKEIRSLGGIMQGDGSFAVPLANMPLQLRTLVAQSKARSEQLHQKVINTLSAMEQNLAAAPTGLTFTKAVDKIVADLQKQFLATVAVVMDDLSVPAQLTPGIAEGMRTGLTESSDFAIKNFALEAIPELRAKVQQNLFAGGRADRLEALLQSEYGVGQRKARFIAENEASLAVSKFREERYKALGCQEYVWRTSHDAKVRHDHRLLDGRTFRFDAPPVVDQATGRRRNPGEDYECRCVAEPILIYPS